MKEERRGEDRNILSGEQKGLNGFINTYPSGSSNFPSFKNKKKVLMMHDENNFMACILPCTVDI